jgi:hypothetical protein
VWFPTNVDAWKGIQIVKLCTTLLFGKKTSQPGKSWKYQMHLRQRWCRKANVLAKSIKQFYVKQKKGIKSQRFEPMLFSSVM